MGGSRSGRYGWRGEMEQRRRLDIREFARRHWLIPGRSGGYSWHDDHGEPWGTAGYTATADALELLYRVCGDEGEGQEVRTAIPIRRVPWRFGGMRQYWACPRCWRRCEVVVMASHGRHWGCRRCLRLRYRSQALAPGDRLEHRSAKLYARAGIEDDAGMVYKHKWMRWRTFNRLMDRANALQSDADAMHLSGLYRILGRLATTEAKALLGDALDAA